MRVREGARLGAGRRGRFYLHFLSSIVVFLYSTAPRRFGSGAVFNCNSDVGGGWGTVSVGFPDCRMESGEIVRKCMEEGLTVSAGSACDAGKDRKVYGGVLEKSGVEERVGR